MLRHTLALGLLTALLSLACNGDGAAPAAPTNTQAATRETTATPTATVTPTTELPLATATEAPPPTEEPPPTSPPPPPTSPPPPRQNCSQFYPTVCIAPFPPDLDCGEIPFRRFQVLQPDPHGFDRDRDGVGCESG